MNSSDSIKRTNKVLKTWATKRSIYQMETIYDVDTTYTNKKTNLFPQPTPKATTIHSQAIKSAKKTQSI